ncbi:MAG: phosphoserine phosphatase SerB [Alphaproteobacteria bacterium]|nr:phosphoserine phosphatase SerB [Alphaproteobacteria bacterium]MBV9692845.1 phosphoserine phosphatase SerB [Alphaproteobacteria bacterium]
MWLSPGRAFDIGFDGEAAVVENARAQCRGDVNAVALAGRRKKLLVADMDSTIITCECLDELADQAGLRSQIAVLTERAMRGEIEFEAALRARVALLKGLPLAALERTWRQRVRLTPGAAALVGTMRAAGAASLLVTGGFAYFAQRVAQQVGFDRFQANRLLDDGVALTGLVAEPILGRDAKRAALESECARLGIGSADALAVGDGANDLGMVKAAGLGVAFHAKPALAQAACAIVAHADLTALLYLQGYSDAQIKRLYPSFSAT